MKTLKPVLEIAKVDSTAILLDTGNPRFLGEAEAQEIAQYDGQPAMAQEVVRRTLIQKYGARGLVESILQMGFLPMDRMVVRRVEGGRYVVVEGNRRLAAVKTILGDIKRKVIDPSPAIVDSVTRIEVLILTPEGNGDDEDSAAMLMQGVRHISGVRNWGPYQQGRLIHTLVLKRGMKQQDAASTVGLSAGRVSTLLRGYHGMQQMFDDPDFGPKASTAMFSYFEQAYLKKSVREWLGWDDASCRYTNTGALRWFYNGIVPNPETGAAAFLAREVRDCMPAILEHPEARKALETGANVQEAYAIAMPRPAASRLATITNARGVLEQLTGSNAETDFSAEDLDVIRQLHVATERLLAQAEA